MLHLQCTNQLPETIQGIGNVSIVARQSRRIVHAAIELQGLVVGFFRLSQFSLLIQNVPNPFVRGANAFACPQFLKNRKRLFDLLPRANEVALVKQDVRVHEQGAGSSLPVASRRKKFSRLRHLLSRLVRLPHAFAGVRFYLQGLGDQQICADCPSPIRCPLRRQLLTFEVALRHGNVGVNQIDPRSIRL